MPHPPATLLFASSLLVRFLIALLLGAQVGLLVFLTPAQEGWLSLVPVLILLVAPLLSLAGDPAVRRGSISRQRLLRALGRALLVLVAPVLALAVLGMLFPPVWLPARLVVFLATSLLIAFSVGGRIVWQADSAALIGWLGVRHHGRARRRSLGRCLSKHPRRLPRQPISRCRCCHGVGPAGLFCGRSPGRSPGEVAAHLDVGPLLTWRGVSGWLSAAAYSLPSAGVRMSHNLLQISVCFIVFVRKKSSRLSDDLAESSGC
jgi:hypothetical protein